MLDKITDKFWEHLPIVPCQEATLLMSKAMDDKLSFKERFDLRLHLMVCDLCVRFLKQVRGLRKLVRSYNSQAEQHLPQKIKEQMKLAIQGSHSA